MQQLQCNLGILASADKISAASEIVCSSRSLFHLCSFFLPASEAELQHALSFVEPLRLYEEAETGTGLRITPHPAAACDLGACSWTLKGPLGGPLGDSTSLALITRSAGQPVQSAEPDYSRLLDKCNWAVFLGAVSLLCSKSFFFLSSALPLSWFLGKCEGRQEQNGLGLIGCVE